MKSPCKCGRQRDVVIIGDTSGLGMAEYLTFKEEATEAKSELCIFCWKENNDDKNTKEGD